MPRAAYTLIEIMAVIGIAGLVAVAVTPALVGVATGDRLTDAVRQVREVDRLARQHAVGVGGTWGIVDGQVVSDSPGWQASKDRLPHGCTVSLFRPNEGAALERLVIDRSGSSGDVQVEITLGGRSRRFRVLGLSGAWLPEPEYATEVVR